MDITIEAIYESGVLKPLEPLEGLNEHDRVRLVLQLIGTVSEQRRARIKLDPETAREIGESKEPVAAQASKLTLQDFEAALDELAEGSEAMPILPSEADSRDFYYQHHD